MDPTVFEISGFSMPSYFFYVMVGFVVAVVLAWWDGKRVGIDPDDVIDMGLWGLILGVAGARLLHVFADGFFMDYVHLCTDPMLVEGRDLWGRPLSELTELGLQPRLCHSDLECYNSMTGGAEVGCFSSPKGYDVGPICNEVTGLCHPEQDCFRWSYFWSGGLVFYGGFLAATFFAVYFTTRHRVGMLWAPKMENLPRASTVPVWGAVRHFFAYLGKFPDAILRFADLGAPSVALALAFGRFACFMAGCCFGEVTYGPLGMQFPGGSAAHQLHRREHAVALAEQTKGLGDHLSLPVHPTQLYAVTAHLLIFAFLFFVMRTRKRFQGQTFAWLLILYSLQRFVIEFFRADYRGELGGLSTSQMISIPVIAVGVFLLVRGAKLASASLIDDGQRPPLNLPLVQTVYQPRTVQWQGVEVSPIEDWQQDLGKLMDKIGGDAAWKGVAVGASPAPDASPRPEPPKTTAEPDGPGPNDDEEGH